MSGDKFAVRISDINPVLWEAAKRAVDKEQAGVMSDCGAQYVTVRPHRLGEHTVFFRYHTQPSNIRLSDTLEFIAFMDTHYPGWQLTNENIFQVGNRIKLIDPSSVYVPAGTTGRVMGYGFGKLKLQLDSGVSHTWEGFTNETLTSMFELVERAVSAIPGYTPVPVPPAVCNCPMNWDGIIHSKRCSYFRPADEREQERYRLENTWGISRQDAERHLPRTRAELNATLRTKGDGPWKP